VRLNKNKWMACLLALVLFIMNGLQVCQSEVVALDNDISANPVNQNVRDGVDLPVGGVVRNDIPGATGGLSTAKNFHIFSNVAELHAHTAGNIATGDLEGYVNFGTSVHEGLVAKDIHYLQKVTRIASSSFVDSTGSRGLKVVFGSDVNLSWVDNGNRLAVNGTKLDHVKKTGEAFIDKNGQKYIDFPTVFSQLQIKSNSFAGNAQTPGVTKDFSDQNNRVIDVSNATVGGGKGSVILSKTGEGGAALPGATFDLYNEGNTVIKRGLVTDGEGKIKVLNELDKGSYYFIETAAPEGYEGSNDPVNFQITDANIGSGGYVYATDR